MNPSILQQYAKALCGALVAACGATATAAADGHISIVDGCLIAATLFGTLGGIATVKNIYAPAQLAQQPGIVDIATGVNRAGVAPELVAPRTLEAAVGAAAVRQRDERGRFVRRT